jgi:threonyl-tRNA synthetase
VVVAPIVSDANDYAEAVTAQLHAAGVRAEADLRNEKINYKVREHSLSKVPVILAVGQREVAERTVSVRRLGEKDSTVAPLEEVVAGLRAEAVAPDLR